MTMWKPLGDFVIGRHTGTLIQLPEGTIVLDFGPSGANVTFETKADFGVFVSVLMSAELRAE